MELLSASKWISVDAFNVSISLSHLQINCISSRVLVIMGVFECFGYMWCVVHRMFYIDAGDCWYWWCYCITVGNLIRLLMFIFLFLICPILLRSALCMISLQVSLHRGLDTWSLHLLTGFLSMYEAMLSSCCGFLCILIKFFSSTALSYVVMTFTVYISFILYY